VPFETGGLVESMENGTAGIPKQRLYKLKMDVLTPSDLEWTNAMIYTGMINAATI
jgi:hypothetical protein